MTVIDNHEALAKDGELSEASARDYFELLKPRVMSLVVFTAFAGLVLAPGHINPVLGLIAILCIAVAPAPPVRSTCGTMPISTPS